MICQQKFVRIVWLHQYYWYGWSQDSNIAPAKCPINHCTFICQTNNTRWIVVKTQTNPQLNHKKLGLTKENNFAYTTMILNKLWNWLTDTVHILLNLVLGFKDHHFMLQIRAIQLHFCPCNIFNVFYFVVFYPNILFRLSLTETFETL